MAKRPFQQVGTTLRDVYQDDAGVTYIRDLPEPLVSPLASDRQEVRGAAESSVDALLDKLQSGDPFAPGALVPFIHDVRVRTALLNAAEKLAVPLLSNVAQALARAKMTEATDVLRKRLQALTSDPRTWEDQPVFNARAATLAAVAVAVLTLEPQTSGAVDTLIRLLGHPTASNRRTAAAGLSEALLELQLPDDVRHEASTALAALLTTDDASMFGAIAPAMAAEQPDVVLARCEELLKSSAQDDRELAVVALAKLIQPEARDILAAHLPHEQDLRLACRLAVEVGQGIPQQLRADVAKRALSDESPSTRHDALLLLSALDTSMSRAIAAEALQDEPDPVMRSKLEVFVAKSVP